MGNQNNQGNQGGNQQGGNQIKPGQTTDEKGIKPGGAPTPEQSGKQTEGQPKQGGDRVGSSKPGGESSNPGNGQAGEGGGQGGNKGSK